MPVRRPARHRAPVVRGAIPLYDAFMTERLYYTDAYLRTFDAHIVDRANDDRTLYLDRTAFYPPPADSRSTPARWAASP